MRVGLFCCISDRLKRHEVKSTCFSWSSECSALEILLLNVKTLSVCLCLWNKYNQILEKNVSSLNSVKGYVYMMYLLFSVLSLRNKL